MSRHQESKSKGRNKEKLQKSYSQIFNYLPLLQLPAIAKQTKPRTEGSTV